MAEGMGEECVGDEPISESVEQPKKPGRVIENDKVMEIHMNLGSAEPNWANGLKQLYNSVVNEPLPDAFRDLLSKLDENQHK